ncbi:MAG: AIR synthase-related protein [Lachnospiraceae bacterium]
MKIGKVSQTVLKRSVQKQLHYRREESVMEPSIEEMCGGIKVGESDNVLVTGTCLYGNQKELGVFALAKVANDLATRGAEIVGAGVTILLPPHAYESRLKAMTEALERAGSAHAIQLFYVKVEVSPVIESAIISVTGVGLQKKGTVVKSILAQPRQDIVLVKWIGLEGTMRILLEKEEELSKRFIPAFLNPIKAWEEVLFSQKEIQMAEQMGASAMQQIGDGGIFAALWEIAEASKVGLEVELKQMSIRQETVEICEYYHLNPYQLTSTGSILVVTDQGKELVKEYEKQGICGMVLGKITDQKERIISGGGEKRYLDRPAVDELVKIYQTEENEA